jgi:hypothetical protein
LLLAAGWLCAAESPAALESSPAGWRDLFASSGAKLEGWTRIPAPKAQLAAVSPWVLDPATGTLLCNGDRAQHEYLQLSTREYGDFILHVEWRFTPVEGDNVTYNSGILFRDSADLGVWHQAQTGPSGGFLFGVFPVEGEKKRVMRKDQMTENRIKPAGEWNVYEISARGPRITLWVNGAEVNDLETPVARGHFSFEAEGYRIEFRNVKIKELQP